MPASAFPIMLRNDVAPSLSLDGTWDFTLGEGAVWGTIQVPGCWEAQGYPKHLEGPAHYRREVFIPDDWAGRRILLEFDAVSYACTVQLNGILVGQHYGLWTPFAVDVTSAARVGQFNTVELEVYKPGRRYPVRSCLAGFLPDVATTFGGIWQSTRLRALTVAFDDLLVDPDPDTGRLRVRCRVVAQRTRSPGGLFHQPARESASEQVVAEVPPGGLVIDVFHAGQLVISKEVPLGESGSVDVTLTLRDPALWSPAYPALYDVRVRLVQGGEVKAEARERIGFRRLAADGDQLLFNGKPAFLRGVLSWGWDPDRIAPAFDRKQVRDEFRRIRALGFNMAKLCLFVPNQVYFDVADEEGVFLWQEWPLWQPQVTPEMRARLPAEYAALMRLTRHHPSVVIYSLGCELSDTIDADLLRCLNQLVRDLASGVLFCDNSGSGEAYEGLPYDFSDFTDYHPYTDLHYFEPLLDHWRRDWQPPRPWIFGEFCDSDDFRDLEEIIAAHEDQQPWWMRDDVPVHTWRPEVRALLEASERLTEADLGVAPQELVGIARQQSLVVRKFVLEAVRRRAGMGGYIVTGLRDTPIATSGIFDDLGRPKWQPDEFRPFNDEAVLCLDGGRARRWQHGGDRAARLDVYNWWAGERARLHVILSHSASPAPSGGEVVWQLTYPNGDIAAGGTVAMQGSIPPGSPRAVAAIELDLPAVQKAQQLQLEAQFSGGRISVANRWPVWVYPHPDAWPTNLVLYDPCYALDDPLFEEIGQRVASYPQSSTPSVVVATGLAPWVVEYLQGGGAVLLLQHGDGPLPAHRGPFWREAIKLFPDHPLWQMFPHQGYADLQFFGLATDVMLKMAGLEQVLPDLKRVWPIMRRLDAREFYVTEYLLEAQVGVGRLLACTLRLQGGSGAQPTGLRHNVAGQYLLWTIVEYLAR